MNNSAISERKNQAISRGVGMTTQIYADRAENSEIWDVEGRRYIDFSSGIAVVNTGHRHPKVIAAVKAQLDRFTHTCHQVVPYESYVRLAERLNGMLPGKFEKKTVFVTTGAEAVENAVKIARHATGRPAVIAFAGGFHGRTFMGMALTGKVVPYKVGFGADAGRRLPRAVPDRAARRVGGRFARRARPAVQGRRRSGARRGHHHRAGAGRRRLLRGAARLHRGAAQDLRPARHPAHRRRGADRFCPHRQDVCDGSSRGRGRPHHDGQEPGRRLSAGGGHRPRRADGRAEPRRARRHLWRQPDRRRRRPCRARRDRGRETLRPRQHARRTG